MRLDQNYDVNLFGRLSCHNFDLVTFILGVLLLPNTHLARLNYPIAEIRVSSDFNDGNAKSIYQFVGALFAHQIRFCFRWRKMGARYSYSAI